LIPQNYQLVLAFLFAIREINNNAELLPNTTLASKIHDSAFDPKESCWGTLDLLFPGQGNPPNYKCVGEEEVMAVIGGLTSQNSIQMANILNACKIPQLSYGSIDSALRDKVGFPCFYRMVPNEDLQYAGIVGLLNHFGWTWIGLIVPDDDRGEMFLRTLRPRLLQSSICIAWMHVIPIVTVLVKNEILKEKLWPIHRTLPLTEVNVILVHGDGQSLEGLRLILRSSEINLNYPIQRVWITTAEWDFTGLVSGGKFTPRSFNGTLSFRLHSSMVPGFQEFVEMINPFQSTFYFIHEFWVSAFLCSLHIYKLNFPDIGNCTGQEKLGSLPGSVFEMGMSGQSYNIYNAIHAVAHAFHTRDSSRVKSRAMRDGGTWTLWKAHPWQLHFFLRNIHFNNSAGEEIVFNYNEDLGRGYDLINLVTFSNESFQRKRVGRLDPGASVGKELIVNESAIMWNPKFHQLHFFLRNIHFNNSAGEEIAFSFNGDLARGYDLINGVTFSNGSFQRKRVGRLDPGGSAGKELIVNASAIVWDPKFHQVLPRSTCVESCHPGQSLFVQQGKPVCLLLRLHGVPPREDFNPDRDIHFNNSAGEEIVFNYTENLSKERELGGWIQGLLRGLDEPFWKSSQEKSYVTANFPHQEWLRDMKEESYEGVNNNAELLPNTTLASRVHESAFDPRKDCRGMLDLLFPGQGNPPNYKCVREEKVMAVIGDLTSQNSIQMANILNAHKIPQLSYGSIDPALRDKAQFPSFYPMVPNEDLQYAGIVALLKHFGWNWIGLIVADDDRGETFHQTLRPRLLQSNICIAWIQVIPIVTLFTRPEILGEKLGPIHRTILLTEVNVILVHGDGQSLEGLRLILYTSEIDFNYPVQRVWITTAQWDFTAVPSGNKLTTGSLNGTLSLRLHSNMVLGFQEFLEMLNPFQSSIDSLSYFWITAIVCSLPVYNLVFPYIGNCTGQETLGSLPGTVFEMGISAQSYNIYNVVHAVAHAVHTRDSSRVISKAMGDGGPWNTRTVQPWQLHVFLRNIHFNNSADEEIVFNCYGNLARGYELVNGVTFSNGSFQRKRVGRLDPGASAGKELIVNASAIVWDPKFHQLSTQNYG
ncbi:Vomeronasal type-2 receptor 26, partial [Varanus komodoensis]